MASWAGHLLLKSAAFPRMSATESCWKSLWTVTLSSSPVWRARALPSLVTWAAAVSCQAPRLSTAIGMNSIPCWWQSSQDLSSFLLWAAARAWPGLEAAPWTWASWRGLMTVTSKSASFPPTQCGIKISAGFSPCPGNKNRPSLVGASAADTAVLWMVSRRLLCLAILSPCQAQLRAWSETRISKQPYESSQDRVRLLRSDHNK